MCSGVVLCLVVTLVVYQSEDSNAFANSTPNSSSGWIDIGAQNLGFHDRTKCLAGETLYIFDLLEYDSETPVSQPVTVALATRDKITGTPISNVTETDIVSPELCFDVEKHILGVSINGNGHYHNFSSSIAWTKSDDSKSAHGRIVKGHIHLKQASQRPDIELVRPISGWASSTNPTFLVRLNDLPMLPFHNATGVSELKVIAQNTMTYETFESVVPIAGGPGLYSLNNLHLPNGMYRWGVYVGLNGWGELSRSPNPKSGWVGWGTFSLDSTAPDPVITYWPTEPDYTQEVFVRANAGEDMSGVTSLELFVNGVRIQSATKQNPDGTARWYWLEPSYSIGTFPVNSNVSIVLVAKNGAGITKAVSPPSTPFVVKDTINLPDFASNGNPGFDGFTYNYWQHNYPWFDCDTDPLFTCTSWEAGKPLYIMAGFKNVGQGTAIGPFSVRTTIDVYDDDDASNDVVIFDVVQEGKTPSPITTWAPVSGGYRKLVGTWNNPPINSTHSIREVCIDAPTEFWVPGNQGNVKEDGEDNNCYQFSVSPPSVTIRPPIDTTNPPIDLSIESLWATYSSSSRYVGDSITLHARVRNEVLPGTNGATSTPATLDMYEDRYYGSGQMRHFASINVPPLEPGSAVELVGTIIVDNTGIRILTASTSPDYHLENNTRQMQTAEYFTRPLDLIEIGQDTIDPIRLPDLVVDTSQIIGTTTSGLRTTIRATLYNSDFRNGVHCAPTCASTMDAGNFLSVLRDRTTGTWLSALNVPSLSAGSSFDAEFDGWVAQVGTYELDVCADQDISVYEGQVWELDENNNCSSLGTITVHPQCNDLSDNDTDGGVDFIAPPGATADTDCTSVDSDKEEGEHSILIRSSQQIVNVGARVQLEFYAENVGSCVIKGSDGSSYPLNANPQHRVVGRVTTLGIDKVTTFNIACTNTAGLPIQETASVFVLVSRFIETR